MSRCITYNWIVSFINTGCFLLSPLWRIWAALRKSRCIWRDYEYFIKENKFLHIIAYRKTNIDQSKNYRLDTCFEFCKVGRDGNIHHFFAIFFNLLSLFIFDGYLAIFPRVNLFYLVIGLHSQTHTYFTHLCT